MADNTSNNIPQRPIGPNGKPLLKKVKRPVKKLVKRPLSPVMPKNPAEPQVSQRPVQQAPRQVQQPQRPPVMPHTTSNNASRPQQQQPRSQQPALQRSVSQQTKQQNPIEKPSSKPVQNDIDINFDDMDDIKNIIADMAAHPEPVQNNEPEVKNLPDRLSSKQNVNKEPPAFVSDSDLDDDAEESRLLIQDGMFSKKILQIAVAAAFVIGFTLAKLFFSTQEIVNNGLQGVVANPEVPRGRARCGIAEKTQGCVLYIMNPQRQDLNARDFYDLASQLTGRQRFVIETGNMRYSNVKISPGEIAQLNIPPLQ